MLEETGKQAAVGRGSAGLEAACPLAAAGARQTALCRADLPISAGPAASCAASGIGLVLQVSWPPDLKGWPHKSSFSKRLPEGTQFAAYKAACAVAQSSSDLNHQVSALLCLKVFQCCIIPAVFLLQAPPLCSVIGTKQSDSPS